MSIKIISLVWEHSDVSCNELLILLALADWAGHDGESCFPSMEQIGFKARCDERTARRIIGKLKEKGYLTVIKPGSGRGHRTEYRVNVDFIESLPLQYHERKRGAVCPTSTEIKGGNDDTQRGASTTVKGGSDDIAIRKNRHRTVKGTVNKKFTSFHDERDQVKRLFPETLQ